MTEPIKIELTLDIDRHLSTFRQVGEEDFIPEPQTLEDLVLAMAANQVVAGLEREVRQELGQRVRSIRDEVIREAVTPLVEKAVGEPVTRTNDLGEAWGEPTTLRQLIMKAATDVLTKPTGDSFARHNRPTMLEKIVSEQVGRAFETEIKAAIDVAKAQVTQVVREKAGAVLSQTIVAMAEASS